MTYIFLQASEGFSWATCPWYFLWLLLGWLLAGILGWLLSRGKKEDNTALIAERDRYHTAATKWEKDYQSLKYQLDESHKTEADLRAGLQRCEADKQTLRYQLEGAESKLSAYAAGGAAIVDDPEAEVDEYDNDTTGLGIASGLAIASNDYGVATRTNAPEVMTGSDWASERAALIARHRENPELTLEVFGNYFANEAVPAGYANAGEARAARIKDLLTPDINADRITTGGRLIEGGSPAAGTLWEAGVFDWRTAAGNRFEFDLTDRTNAEGDPIVDSSNSGEVVEPTSAYNGLFERDNFQIIEGVGPKVNEVLINAGYRTWDDLARADVADLRRHLADAGSRFSLSDPTSWPHQARLAADGNWDELIRYQKFTDAGRETTGDFESDSKFEKLAAKKLGFSSANPNDLKVVEGIGPKIEQLLKDAGIKTWRELSVTSVERLQEILTAAGDRYKLAVPRTWPQQAQMAADGEWESLRRYQNELKGGK